jgi:hypothetical protein
VSLPPPAPNCSCTQGQDSVGAALAFSLFELARHPDVQERVVRELNEVFGSDDRTPSLSDLRRLQYLEQCIKETLRLYPSVPLMSRTLTEDAKLGTAASSCSAIQQIFRFSLYLRVHYQVYKSPPPHPILTQINPVYVALNCLFMIKFNFILPSPLRSS